MHVCMSHAYVTWQVGRVGSKLEGELLCCDGLEAYKHECTLHSCLASGLPVQVNGLSLGAWKPNIVNIACQCNYARWLGSVVVNCCKRC